MTPLDVRSAMCFWASGSIYPVKRKARKMSQKRKDLNELEGEVSVAAWVTEKYPAEFTPEEHDVVVEAEKALSSLRRFEPTENMKIKIERLWAHEQGATADTDGGE